MRIPRLVLSIVVTISILVSFICVSPLPAAAGDEGVTPASKISGALAAHIQMKLHKIAEDAGQVENTIQGVADLAVSDFSSFGDLNDLESERIFIHFTEQPTEDQINDLESEGITAYPESWIPPTGNHPTGFIVAEMPLEKLETLAAKDYVVRLNTGEETFEIQNDVAAEAMGADHIWSGGNYGAGVTVAVIDSGLDITNDDLPALTAYRDYSNYPTLDNTINDNTYTGHGTHVAGSVLGRGTSSSGAYKGVASAANLVFLKIGINGTGSATTEAMTQAIRAAVDTYHVDIITMSYGGWSQYHDGSLEPSISVDYAVSQGVTVFISAGNDATRDWHYSGTVAANDDTELIPVSITSFAGESVPLLFNLVWWDGEDNRNDLSMKFYAQDQTTEITAIINDPQLESENGTESTSSYWGPDADHFYILPNGTYKRYLKVHNASSNSQFFHIYSIRYYKFSFDNPDPEYTLGSPAEADGAIAVGAYVTRTVWTDYTGVGQSTSETLNQIATFSSRGPRVDEDHPGTPNKPEIVAPGSQIISIRDNSAYPWPTVKTDNDHGGQYLDLVVDNGGASDGNGPADYFAMSGTSMACPLAAGVGALILSKCPSLTPAQVKQLLLSTANDLGAAGYDEIYGYGMIDAQEAVNSVSETKLVFTTAAISVTAGTASSAITIQTQNSSSAAANVSTNLTVVLASESGTGRFDTSASGLFNGEVTSVDIPAGANTATFYYKDPSAGTPLITVSADGLTNGTQEEIITSDTTVDDLTIDTQPASNQSVDHALSTAAVVTALDSNSNPIEGASIVASKNTGTGTLGGTTTEMTAADGRATFDNLTYDRIDGFTIQFTSGAATITSNTVGPLAAGAATQVRVETAGNGSGTVVPTQSLNAGSTLTVFGVTRDQFGNYVGNPAGTAWTMDRTGGVLAGDLSASPAASVTLTGHLSGTAVIHATNGALTAGVSGIITVAALTTVDHLGITTQPASTLSVDHPLSTAPVVGAYDVGGNPIAGVSIVADRDPATGAGTIGGTTTVVTGSNGLATFSNLTYNRIDDFKIRFTGNTKTTISNTVNHLAAGTAVKLQIETAANGSGTVVAAETLTAGQTLTVYGITRDQYDNFVANPAGTAWSLYSSTGGVANSDLGASPAANITFTGHLAGIAVIHAVNGTLTCNSNTITVNPGAAAEVSIETKADGTGTIVGAQTLETGTALTVYGVTRDQYGNYIGNPADTVWAIDVAGNVIADDLSASPAANVTLTGAATGTAVLHATNGGLTAGDSGTITVTNSAAVDHLSIDTQPDSSLTLDDYFNTHAVVIAYDSENNPVPFASIKVDIAAGNGSGTLRGTVSVATNELGEATFSQIGYNKADAFQVRFTSNSKEAVSNTIDALAAGDPAYIRVETKSDGTGTVVSAQNLKYNTALTVYSVVHDQFGNFIENAAADDWMLPVKSGGALDSYLTAAVDKKSATLKGTKAGTAVIRAVVSGLDSVNSGVISMKAKSSGSTGGGGGGGAPPPAAPSLQTTGLNSAAPVTMNTDGTTKAAAQYKTGDSKLTLDIASGTKMINSQGKTLTTLSAAVLANPPAAPEGNAVLLAYELGPEGAAFTPALTITFSYGTLPEGAKNISLMYWNGTAWESVQANVDTVKGTITASISHFSKYAMVYQLPTPANITFAGITISPQTVKPDEKVTIQASVANSGDLSGSYKLVLKVNDRQVDSKEVTIAGGKTETVSFEVQRGIEAEYTVDVNGQKGKFTVGSPAPATPPTSSTPNTPSTPETTPSVAPFTTEPAFTAQASPTLSSTVPVITTSAIPSPTPEDNKSTPFNWALLVGIIGAVAVLVVIMVVVARRPKKKA